MGQPLGASDMTTHLATFWLSFAHEEPEYYVGAVLVDGVYPDEAEGFILARLAMAAAGLQSPDGCQCAGTLVTHDMIPASIQEAWYGLPRLQLLTLDDLRVLGPMTNIAGEDR